MKYIDIHAHAFRKPVPFVTHFHTPAQLAAEYDKFGIEAGFLLPVVNSEIYLPQANEDILDMAETYPKRFFPFCNIDPRALINRADAQLDKVIEYYKNLGCLGASYRPKSPPIRSEPSVVTGIPTFSAQAKRFCTRSSSKDKFGMISPIPRQPRFL